MTSGRGGSSTEIANDLGRKWPPMGERKIRRRDFVFQAEDGIRDRLVTGVQTCALPICALDTAGVPNPAYREVYTREEAKAAAGAIGFPCIIKPSDANSSKGVQQLSGAEKLEDA